MNQPINPPSSLPPMANPAENKSKAETAGAAVTAVSSRFDPFPHLLMAGLCGSGGVYAYTLGKQNPALVAGAFALSYLYSGYAIQQGNHQRGYDVGSLTSIALMLATAPHAYRTRETYSSVMAGLGSVSMLGNVLKSYQIRTGRPKERVKGY